MEDVFGLCYLLGFSFMPRIRDLADQQLYRIDRDTMYPNLSGIFRGGVDVSLIREQWDQLVRVAASLKNRVCPAHVIIQRLSVPASLCPLLAFLIADDGPSTHGKWHMLATGLSQQAEAALPLGPLAQRGGAFQSARRSNGRKVGYCRQVVGIGATRNERLYIKGHSIPHDNIGITRMLPLVKHNAKDCIRSAQAGKTSTTLAHDQNSLSISDTIC